MAALSATFLGTAFIALAICSSAVGGRLASLGGRSMAHRRRAGGLIGGPRRSG